MIADRAKALVDLAKEKLKRTRVSDKTSRFTQLRDNLREVCEELTPAHATTRLFRDEEIGEVMAHPEAIGLRQNLSEPLRRFDDQPEWMLDQRNLHFSTFRSMVRELCAGIERELRANWDDYATDKIPPINREELDVFADEPKLSPQVAKIRELIGIVVQLGQRLPREKDQLQLFHDKIKELTRAWKKLTDAAGGNAPAEVIEFLQRAGTVEGAPLTLLNRVVLDWLEKNRRTSRYVVKAIGLGQSRM